jgi:YHS domain-containing protein
MEIKMSIDPVCGMEVNSKTSNWVTDYKGKTYYFCSEGCMKAFNMNPDHYLNRDSFQKPTQKHRSMGGCCGGIGTGNKWIRYVYFGIIIWYLVSWIMR